MDDRLSTAHDELPRSHPPVVSREEWEEAWKRLLLKEKALTHARDDLAAERQRMPWLALEEDYAFDGPDGKVTLADLFAGRRQLIVYRAFHEPGVFGWPDHACRGCSMVADQVAHLAHLNARDTTLVFASRAPQADIARLSARVSRFMTEAAFEEFPELKEMDARQIREFGNLVTGSAGDFALKIAHLAFSSQE